MVRVTPPYFFDEFLLPVSRKTPSARERLLGLSVKDLEWLNTLYYASHSARQNPQLHTYPMCVEKLLINVAGQPAMPLAGAFVMSPSPDGGKALLYTPYGGIQVADDHARLLTEVGKQLADPLQRVELLSFQSIAQRNALPLGTAIILTTQIVEGPVQEDQEQTLQACQQANVLAMLEQLQKAPTLPNMLDTLLGIMARTDFLGLDQRDTRVNCFIQDPVSGQRRWVASLPLSEALLQFYVKHAWPREQTREFVNPKHDTTAFTPAQLEQDRQRWEMLIQQISNILSRLLDSLLQTYWNEDINNGTSRLNLFAQIMADKFRVDILLKRQQKILSAGESHMLQAMFLSDQTARRTYASHLSVEKVRVYAPYQHYVELAGTLAISETHAYLYTQSRGLQVLEDLDDLKDTLLSMLKSAGHEDELLNFLSLDERNTFIGLDQINIAVQPATAGIFTSLVEDIALKQTSNMNHALALYRRNDGQVDLAALLDYALDIRTMLDHRLATLDTGGRWTVHPVASGSGRPSTVRAERAKLHLQRLEAAEDALASERQNRPTLRSMATLALNAELQKQQQDLNADEVFINTYATQAQEREERPPVSSLSMVEHFIERLSREATPVAASSRTWFYSKPNQGVALKLHSMTLKTFNGIIDQVMLVFANHSMRELPRLYLANTRDKHAHSMLNGLRSEAELRRLNTTMTPGSQQILDAVLQPESLSRVTRYGINGFLPDAYGLTLATGTPENVQPLANTFLLTERGGIDPQRSGHVVLWTPRRGYEAFPSIQALRTEMTQRLAHPIQRLSLLENLPVSRRVPHQVYRLGPLQRIDDNVLNNRLQTYSDYVLDDVDRLLSMKLPARALQDRLDTVLEQAAPTNLTRAIAIARATINQQALPTWLGMALAEEQIHQVELLEQYHNSAPDEKDYLQGITPIRKHTSTALLALLQVRFPGQKLDPDDVLIPAHQALDIHVYSLTDFALRHWPDLNAENIRPRSRTATPLPDTLDANAVIQMVRQLDLKTHYQTLLQNMLNPQTEEGRKRRDLFCRQLPWQTLQYAHEQKLQERLSARALNMVQQVFNMPDALARGKLTGASAIIRSLALIATESAASVKALGMYLIGPETRSAGPLVLHAPYSEKHVFKEYANEQALLDELERPGELQEWTLTHLEAPHQATYRNLLQNNRRPSSDIRLAKAAISGNVLHDLFTDNTQILLKMLAGQFEQGAKRLWDRAVDLLGEGIPNAVQFMAGKLAYPLVVWRSYQLFKRSAEALQLHKWKAALKDFISGVAQMAALGRELEGTDASPPAETAVAQADLSDQALPTATTLTTLKITSASRTRLQPFENHDIALKDLELSTSSQVYTDKTTLKNYVPLEGKVYSVKKTAKHWRLAQGSQAGPYVGRNAQGKWVLDLSRHHPRFGKTLSRMKVQTSVEKSIDIEATGIRQIAALSSWQARVIDEALNVATYYANNCHRNLVRFSASPAPDHRVGVFLHEMFGVPDLSTDQVDRIRSVVHEILEELCDSSLTSQDSNRFVSGSTAGNGEEQYAFIIPADPGRKLYLLERFFYPQMGVYHGRLHSPFDISAHARACTLIHELSHLKLSTEDLAYLDSMRPFPDLINTALRGSVALKTELEDVRKFALSTLTPSDMLFKVWNDYSEKWEDYGDGTSTQELEQKVLDTTGGKTLDDARVIFMSNDDKRIDTILANADSLTYLISELGRLLDAGA